MQSVSARVLAGALDAAPLQDVARRAWPSTWHPGGLGWAVGTSQLAEQVALFLLGDQPVGWGGADRSGRVLTQIDRAHGHYADLLVEWCLGAVDAGVIEVNLGDHDDDLIAAFRNAGFQARDDIAPIFGMFRAVRVPVGAPDLPPGYAVRATTPDEVPARVEAHRAAWLPSALPWHPDHRPEYPPESTSSYDLACHDRVTRTPLYDIDLDLVVETPYGSLAGCCVIWFDPRLGVAEIEPLGVHPAHRRKGLAMALCHEAVARVARRGGTEVFINAGPREDYPATAAAYAKAAFVTRPRARTYRLTRQR